MIRIVKMHFKEIHCEDFLRLFHQVKDRISAFEGCIEVKLLRDINQPDTFFTISKWENEEALHNYRNSDLFKTTWALTKALFASPAQAWSLDTAGINPDNSFQQLA